MNYSLDTNTFSVPDEIVDKHLRFAGAAQLKVILFLLRHGGQEFSPDELSKALFLSAGDVSDALSFWEQNGFFSQDIPKDHAIPAMSASVEIPVKKLTLSKERTKLSSADCARLVSESEKIRFLVSETEVLLGKILSRGELETLISLNDWAGMPVDVILMAIHHCKSTGHENMRYIEKVVLGWCDSGITTVEAADKHINELNKKNTAWEKIRKLYRLEKRKPSEKEESFCNDWINTWCFSEQMLLLAYNTCVDNTGKFTFQYTNAVLRNWYSKNIDTPDKITDSAEHSTDKSENTSYRISDIEKMLDTEFLDSI